MLSLPLYTLLFLYLIFLAVFLSFMIINFYHIIINASFILTSFIVSFLTSVLGLLTIYFTFTLLHGIDWRQPLILFSSNWFGF